MRAMTDIARPTPVPPSTAATAAPSAAVSPPAARVGKKYDRSIVEGPLSKAVWKIAWPTILTNLVFGIQGFIDHLLVGHLVGFRGNAAIGVANQVFIVVIAFIMSVFTGMSVLVARSAGAGDEEAVDRAVYQAFLVAVGISLLIMAPIGYFASPAILNFMHVAPDVQQEALPFLRIMFVFSSGMLVSYMLSGALRSAGDARTPMIMGIALTVLNIGLNVIFIDGLGPIPAYGTKGAAIGTSIASGIVGLYSIWKLWSGGWVVSFRRAHGYAPDWKIIRSLFRFGLPAGIQGIAMNIGGVLMLTFIGSLAQSAAAQAAFAVSYSQLFAFVTWTSSGLMGAAGAIAGQNLGAGKPERAVQGVRVTASIGVAGAAFLGLFYFFFPEQLLALFSMRDPEVVRLGVQLLRVLSISGLFITVALTYTGGLQGTGDTRSPLYISVVSQVIVPLGICWFLQQRNALDPIDIWLAILVGHACRCVLSVLRFRQGKWRQIKV